MASDIWLRTILIVRKETRCHHIGYSYRLTARVLLYAPSHRQDNTYHGLCYTSRGALAGTRNSSMGNAYTYMGWRGWGGGYGQLRLVFCVRTIWTTPRRLLSHKHTRTHTHNFSTILIYSGILQWFFVNL